jgi:hypothetical protein
MLASPPTELKDRVMTDPTASRRPVAAEPWRRALLGLRGGLAACILFSFALNLLMFAVPLHSLQLFDRVLSSGHLETLLLLSLITGLALLSLGLLWTQAPTRLAQELFQSDVAAALLCIRGQPSAPSSEKRSRIPTNARGQYRYRNTVSDVEPKDAHR